VRKSGLIATGLTVGIVAEIVAVRWVYAGANLFHGGHPNAVANILLPGIAIVDHLSSKVPAAVPLSLFLISLVQLPAYGALGGRDWANKAISTATKAALVLHLAASFIAFYGLFQEKRWQADLAQYGVCARANTLAEDLSRTSSRIISLVRWTEQSRKQITRLKNDKADGAVFVPDPEPNLLRTLDGQENELEQQWDIYRRLGGTAHSPAEVAVIPSPCGKQPARPYLF
jgi:hypothetical protein